MCGADPTTGRPQAGPLVYLSLPPPPPPPPPPPSLYTTCCAHVCEELDLPGGLAQRRGGEAREHPHRSLRHPMHIVGLVIGCGL